MTGRVVGRFVRSFVGRRGIYKGYPLVVFRTTVVSPSLARPPMFFTHRRHVRGGVSRRRRRRLDSRKSSEDFAARAGIQSREGCSTRRRRGLIRSYL